MTNRTQKSGKGVRRAWSVCAVVITALTLLSAVASFAMQATVPVRVDHTTTPAVEKTGDEVSTTLRLTADTDFRLVEVYIYPTEGIELLSLKDRASFRDVKRGDVMELNARVRLTGEKEGFLAVMMEAVPMSGQRIKGVVAVPFQTPEALLVALPPVVVEHATDVGRDEGEFVTLFTVKANRDLDLAIVRVAPYGGVDMLSVEKEWRFSGMKKDDTTGFEVTVRAGTGGKTPGYLVVSIIAVETGKKDWEGVEYIDYSAPQTGEGK